MRENASASHRIGRREQRVFPAHSPSSLEASPRKGNGFSLRKKSILNYAYKLLSYRGRSEKELRQRLILKGFDEYAVDTVITGLAANGFLDDRKLAYSLKRYAEESKHLGISGTKRFLRERGIPKEIIDETVNDIDEMETAEKIVEKMMRSSTPYPLEKTIRRIYNALSRKGHSPETIKRTLDKFIRKEDGR